MHERWSHNLYNFILLLYMFVVLNVVSVKYYTSNQWPCFMLTAKLLYILLILKENALPHKAPVSV